MDQQEFLNAIAGSDVEKRFRAWRSAGEQSAAVVEKLVELTAAKDPGVAKAASEALTTMAHAVGKDANDPKRAAGGSTQPEAYRADVALTEPGGRGCGSGGDRQELVRCSAA